MGGKAKQAQRTKNNVRPSSSGRSAELLSSTHGGSSDGGGGISLFPSLAAAAPAPGLNTDLTLIVKKLNKKDPITKTKALQELNELVKNSEVEDVAALLPNWAHFYKVLSMDPDRKVRELTQLCHGSVVQTCGRRVAPHLRAVLPVWLLAAHDDHAPARARAMLALTTTFPGDKLAEAIAFCGDDVMTYLIDNILNRNLNVGKKTEEDACALEQSARAAGGALGALRLVLCGAPAARRAALWDALAPVLQASAFWKLPANASEAVRLSWCGLAGDLAQRFGAQYMSPFGARALRACVSSRDHVTLTHWAAWLQLLHADKEAISREKLGDTLSSRVLATIEDGGWGSAAELTDTLPQILDVLDNDNNIQIVEFYEKLFEAFVSGLKKRRVNSAKGEMAAWLRGLAHCIDRASQSEATRASSVHALRLWVSAASAPGAPAASAAAAARAHGAALCALAARWSARRRQLLGCALWQAVSVVQAGEPARPLDAAHVAAHVALLRHIRDALRKEPKKSSNVRFEDVSSNDLSVSQSPRTPETPVSMEEDVAEHTVELLSELHRAEERAAAAYIDAVWTDSETEQTDGSVVSGVMDALLPLLKDFDAERIERVSLAVCGAGAGAGAGLHVRVLVPWLRAERTRCAAVFRTAVLLADKLPAHHAAPIWRTLDECELHVWEWAVEYCDELPACVVTSRRAAEAAYVLAARAHRDGHALAVLTRALRTPGAVSTSTASAIAGEAANALDAGEAGAPAAAAALAQCLAEDPPNAYALLIISLCRHLLTHNEDESDASEVVLVCQAAVRLGVGAMDDESRRVALSHLAVWIRRPTTSISRVGALFPILLEPDCTGAELANTISLLLPTDSAARAEVAAALTRLAALSGNATTPVRPPHDVYKDDVLLETDVVLSFMREVELLGSFTRSSVTSAMTSHGALTELVLRLLHSAAMLRALAHGYVFWERYDELAACEKRVDEAVKQLTANVGRDIWPTLAARAAQSGGSWAAAAVYLEKLVPDLEPISPEHLEDMSADGFFDSLQERAALRPDSSAECEAACLSARRAVLAAAAAAAAAAAPAAPGGNAQPPHPPPPPPGSLDLVAELQLAADAHYATRLLLTDTDISSCEWLQLEATMRVTRLCSLCVSRVGWDLPSPLWDFVTVFLSSLLSSLKRSSKSWGSCAVACIAVPTLELYQAVDMFISSVPEQCTRRQPADHVAALPQEWRDVFAADNNAALYDFILHVLESCASSARALSPSRAHTTSALTACCPSLRWSSTTLEWHLQCGGPRRVLATALAVMSAHSHPPALGLAYKLMLYMCPALVQHDVEELSSESAAELESAMTLLQPELTRLLDLVEAALHRRDSKPHSDDDDLDQETRRAALSLLLLVEVVGEVVLVAGGVRAGLALRYGEELRGGDGGGGGGEVVARVVAVCMRLLPAEVATWVGGRRAGTAAPKLHASAFITQPHGMYRAAVANDVIERLACRALCVCVRGGGVRAADAALRRVAAAYISPHIIRQALQDAARLRLPDIEVRVRGDELEVCAAVDEQSVRVCLKLAADHPLTPPAVLPDSDVGRGAAQPDSRWLGLYLAGRGCAGGGGGVAEAVRVWGGAVRARVDAAPCCYICYSRLAAARLPAAHCRQCKNAFHTTCLRKWFASSNKSSCPLCRTDF